MTSARIRQSFLDFFRARKHTIVRSSSLMPESPNLLFTNSGMNQFVPIFLGERPADVDRWAGALAGLPTRAADTQKCIRAGGKHNDLDDVGLDTYHHTFFEMLGNWSFGDYFKKEAIDWAWELVVEIWKFPPARLYATIYNPDPAAGDPAERDAEAWDHWAEKFRSVGLDPAVQIVDGNRKDNFWMMGETGPCGPCSEIHVDLTPAGDSAGSLVNAGDPRCIEIWNLVFIQFNADPDGSFSPLPARHVDTGMGFERVASIIQGTKNFTDFAGARISNYETDIFRPIFDAIEALSGRKYASTLPRANASGAIVPAGEQEQIDVAFRVIADHVRTLGFAIADGIEPGNSDRHYVLRRILRRAVRYGRVLGFHEPFFFRLVGVLAETMGDVFPEIRERQRHVEEVFRREEESFNRTLDKGIDLFEREARRLVATAAPAGATAAISGEFAFRLYDEQGFPLDLTELMARERGLVVDVAAFDRLMEAQRARARAAQKKTVIELSEVASTEPTHFVGYETLATPARVLEVITVKDRTAVVVDASAAYAEMGGQVGDSGELTRGTESWRFTTTARSGNVWLHFVEGSEAPEIGTEVTLTVDAARRAAIERHHTVTHLLHWALHEVVSRELSQKGSYVGPDKLSFDFNHAPLTRQQVVDVERVVNELIVANEPVTWTEVPYAEIRERSDVMQFFGDKYGGVVRVVQVGGRAGALDGYSMELCGGTHVRGTGSIGIFRISGEAAIAAGIRRIEALSGLEAYEVVCRESDVLRSVAGRLAAQGLADLESKVDALIARQKALEKSLRSAQQREAAAKARTLIAAADGGAIVANLGDLGGEGVMGVLEALKAVFDGVIVLGATDGGAVVLVASVPKGQHSRLQAGRIIQAIAPLVGGRGGGKPEFARGGGTDGTRLDEALAEARRLIAAAG